jgi:hypothetical protein
MANPRNRLPVVGKLEVGKRQDHEGQDHRIADLRIEVSKQDSESTIAEHHDSKFSYREGMGSRGTFLGPYWKVPGSHEMDEMDLIDARDTGRGERRSTATIRGWFGFHFSKKDSRGGMTGSVTSGKARNREMKSQEMRQAEDCRKVKHRT